MQLGPIRRMRRSAHSLAISSSSCAPSDPTSLKPAVITITAPARQANQSGLIRIITQDEANKPVSGVTVQIKRNSEDVSAIATNEKGEAEATNLAPGKYEIVVSKDGFETRAQQEVTLSGAAVEVKFTLTPKIALSDKVDIKPSPSAAAAPEHSHSVATE